MLSGERTAEIKTQLEEMPLDQLLSRTDSLLSQISLQKRKVQNPNNYCTREARYQQGIKDPECHNELFDDSIELAYETLLFQEEILKRIYLFNPKQPINAEVIHTLTNLQAIERELIPITDHTLGPSFTQSIFNLFWNPVKVFYLPQPTTEHIQLFENAAVNPLTTPEQFATVYVLLSNCAFLDKKREAKDESWVANVLRIVENDSLTEKELATKRLLNENNGITSLISCYEHYRYDLMSDSELAQLASPIQAGDVQKISAFIGKYGKDELQRRTGAYVRRLQAHDLHDYRNGKPATRIIQLMTSIFDFSGATQHYSTNTGWYLTNAFVAIYETEPYILTHNDIFALDNVTPLRLLVLSYVMEWIFNNKDTITNPFEIDDYKEFYITTLTQTLPSLLERDITDKPSLMFLQYSIEAMARNPSFANEKRVLKTMAQQITEATKR